LVVGFATTAERSINFGIVAAVKYVSMKCGVRDARTVVANANANERLLGL
jgi:hypothetical protein